MNASRSETVDWTRWVHDVRDYPQPGIVFRDLTPLWADGPVWKQAADCLAREAARQSGATPRFILAIEARGFLVAQALADRWGSGVLLARKPGKLPRVAFRQEYELEYGLAGLELHDHALLPGSSVLVADDVLATGGTAEAALRLVEDLGANPVGLAFLIELAALGGRDRLGGLPITSLITYREEDEVDLLS